MPKIKFKCAGCGKEFEDYASNRRDKAVYCSRNCPGRHLTPETRAKMSKSLREYYLTHSDTNETRAKKSIAGKLNARKRNLERGVIGKAGRAWKIFNKMPFDIESVAVSGRMVGIPHAACYLKEARAMLQGKDTRGKNRCQKLIGDD